MSVILKRIWNNLNYVLYELNDERTRDTWPNATTLVTILLGYLYFVKKAGPAWMKNKKPYELKNTILVYNVFQIVVSSYIFYESFFNIWLKEYNWMCQPVNYSNDPINTKGHNLVWLYLVIKFVDFLDTIFFVLRKKDRQISGLHLYHHFMMPVCTWIGFKYYPNGHSTFLGVINCFVHIIMYTYYLIAGLGPQYQKYLWWKKHVTTLQLVQFLLIFIHEMTPLLVGCDYPRWVNWSIGLSALQFVYMFGSFYYVNYIKNESVYKKQKQK